MSRDWRDAWFIVHFTQSGRKIYLLLLSIIVNQTRAHLIITDRTDVQEQFGH